MTDLRGQWRDVGAALFADEVGIEYGIYGAYRLKSTYQPIFAPQEGHLVPVAVEAVAQPQLRGRPARLDAFFESVAPGDRPFVERLLLRLHLGNYRNLDVSGLGLFFTYGPMAGEDPQRALAEIRLMARHRDELELDAADMLMCEIADPAQPEDRLPARIAREMRRNGLAVALGGFGADLAAQERLALLKRHQQSEIILGCHDQFEPFAQDGRTLLRQQCLPAGQGAGRGIDCLAGLPGIEGGHPGQACAGGRIGHLETGGDVARGPMAVDIGVFAVKPPVGQAVERFMALMRGEMGGHDRASVSDACSLGTAMREKDHSACGWQRKSLFWRDGRERFSDPQLPASSSGKGSATSSFTVLMTM